MEAVSSMITLPYPTDAICSHCFRIIQPRNAEDRNVHASPHIAPRAAPTGRGIARPFPYAFIPLSPFTAMLCTEKRKRTGAAIAAPVSGKTIYSSTSTFTGAACSLGAMTERNFIRVSRTSSRARAIASSV